MGSTRTRLHWKVLEELVGVDALKRRVLALNEMQDFDDEKVKMAAALAVGYTKGELRTDSFRDGDDD